MTQGKMQGKSLQGLRVVAVFEALKGVLVLLVGCGLLTFVHKDLHDAAEQLVRHIHLNPARHYPRIFIDAADRVTDTQLWAMAFSALCYAAVRFAEAYGLWLQLQWAEWFGLLSGGMYIPLEIFQMVRHPTWPHVTVLTINLGVVCYLAYAIYRSRGLHRRRDD